MAKAVAAEVDVKDFFKAVKNGDVATVKALLKQDKALLDARDADRNAPLHWAAWKGQIAVITALLDAGADVNVTSDNTHWGTTPLHAAAHGNQRAAAELLLSRGADLTAKNPAGRTPLAETTLHNASAVAKLLRAQGAL